MTPQVQPLPLPLALLPLLSMPLLPLALLALPSPPAQTRPSSQMMTMTHHRTQTPRR
ncbi:MAG: hypothetical protein GY738_27935 [Pseudoalteromonas sp.]|nr:hypothetical protein [Pseudoalteromonas sp.]